MLAMVLLLGLTVGPALAREPHRTAEEARTRMEHHLREVNQLATHFEGVLKTDCPRFDSSTEWKTYFDGEVERVVTLMAHLEQAWVEAKATGDDEVRRQGTTPARRRSARAARQAAGLRRR